ncbi:MAG: hypothetical protein U9Q78_09065 [Chloroflexota bacterium]|nr:hypothetical protein [Chloroflexota bacterium]
MSGRDLTRLEALNLAHLRVDLHLSRPGCGAALRRAAAEGQALGAPLEVALFLSDAAEDELQALLGLLEEMGQHGHIVSVHNGPRVPPFAERFAADPEAIDSVMYQAWGTRGEDDGWLAAGIEDWIQESLKDWNGSAVFAEYGYERNPDLSLNIPGHAFCDAEHTRRGAWRGTFCALGVIHGFENSWGPWMNLDQDQPGLAYLLHLRRFFIEVVPFHRMQPASTVVVPSDRESGHRPLALSSEDCDVVAVYLPVGGRVELDLPVDRDYNTNGTIPGQASFSRPHRPLRARHSASPHLQVKTKKAIPGIGR